MSGFSRNYDVLRYLISAMLDDKLIDISRMRAPILCQSQESLHKMADL